MKKTIVFMIGFFLLTPLARSQESNIQTHTICLNYQQIKEQMNYGLVFKGPGIGYAFSDQYHNKNRILAYEGRILLSVVMTRDILAPSFDVVPLKLDYLFKTGSEGKVCVGPYLVTEYNYQLYPDLQSGYSFWFTHYSLGAAVSGWFPVKKSRMDLTLHTTVCGLTSRQTEIEDPYFFDLSFGYAMKYVHQDFQFGSWDRYYETEVEIKWTPGESSRLAYAYSLEILSYAKVPTLTLINNTIKIIILPKKFSL
jgi:hypothetical protein